MRKLLNASLGLLFFTLFVSVTLVSAGSIQRGSIRGTVYHDLDGNGVCGGNDTRVSNFKLDFASADGSERVSLVSGSNGTYGLVGAGLGEWTVTAVPPSSSWRVTSTNPRITSISSTSPVRLGINFCVQGGSSVLFNQVTSTQPPVTAASIIGSSTSTIVTTIKNEPPSADLEVNYAVSEQLLTVQLEGPTDEELEEVVEEESIDASVAELPDWLTYLNQFRSIGNLSPLSEATTFTQGSTNHARFMVLNDLCCAHSENPNNPLFTLEGNSSGINGNIFASSWTGAQMEQAVNFWMSAPFHTLGIIDPALQEAGYGEFRQDIGVFRYAAVLDVRANEIGSQPVDGATFPIFYPADGAETFIVRRSLPEWPDPLQTAACAGYRVPTGPPIILMIGEGNQVPRISSQRLFEDGRLVQSCAFSELSYTNPNAYAQQTGRSILNSRDAVVMTPRNPLVGGSTYRVELTVNGQEYAWEFRARGG